VAGNVDHDRLCSLVEGEMETGRRLSSGAAPKVRAAGKIPAPHGATLVRRRSTEQAHICLGTAAQSRRDPDRFAFGVVNSALGGGMSSRLFQEIREKRGLAYAVYSYHSMFAETGLFAVYAGTTPSRAEEVLDIARRELDDISENGLHLDELERAGGHMKGSLVLSLEDTSGRMSRIGRSEISHGEILSVDEVLERIDSVGPEDAHRAARNVLSQPMALAVIGPFEQGAFDTRGGPVNARVAAGGHAAARVRNRGRGRLHDPRSRHGERAVGHRARDAHRGGNDGDRPGGAGRGRAAARSGRKRVERRCGAEFRHRGRAPATLRGGGCAILPGGGD